MSSHPLFAPVPVPRHHRSNLLRQHGRWYTWSARALAFFERCQVLKVRPLRPQVKRVPRCEPYGETLHLDLASLDRAGLRGELRTFAASLHALKVTKEMMMFRDLYRGDAHRTLVDSLLAWLRAELVAAAGDQRAALFSPPMVTRAKRNEFLLHADLFVVNRLWLIFDDVPSDGSGSSTFVPRGALFSALERVPTLRLAARTRLHRLLRGSIGSDSFNQLYRLLHGRSAWHADLQAALERCTMRIALREGEGYLLNDRHWLHGRDRVTGEIGTRRFRRLTFGRLPKV